jgi:hypothetical protein
MWPDLAEVNPSRPSSLFSQGGDVTARSDEGRDSVGRSAQEVRQCHSFSAGGVREV